MAAQWNSIFTTLPTNGSTVYIRTPDAYSDPILATWNLSTQLFTTVDTALLIPAYTIGRWKLNTVPSPGIGSGVIGSSLKIG